MTIKYLWQIVKQFDNVMGEIVFEAFRGHKIAIDISILQNKNLYGAYKHEYGKKNNRDDEFEDVDEETADTRFHIINIELANSLLSYGILPTFVFDGDKRPEKEDTCKSRDKANEDKENKIKKLEKKKHKLSKEEKETLASLKSAKRVTKTHNEETKNILKYIGFPCLTATYDAEKLCTMLCLEGKVKAVYSSDGDNLAMGCPMLLTKHKTVVEKGQKVRYFEYARLKHALKGLNMDKKKFLHMCVLLGTDFNKNIYGMGKVQVMKYLEDNDRIDKEALYEMYGENCKEFFKTYKKSLEILGKESSSDCCQDEEINLELNVDTSLLRERLSEYGLGNMTPSIISAINKYNELV